MKSHFVAAALLGATLFSAPALADNRIVWKTYDEATVVSIPGKLGIQSTIQFEEGERVENVAVGDSAGWQVTPNRRADLLFLKPLLPDSRTNMTVVTDRRTYLFDLNVTSKGTPLYVMRFAYPNPTPVETKPVAAVEPPAITPAPVAEAAPPAPAPTDLNFAWEMEGTEKLLPAQLFDDGKATYLRWPPGAELPAILVPDSDGVDGPANYAMRNDMIVIEGVPAHITLRNGKRTARLTSLIQTAEAAARP